MIEPLLDRVRELEKSNRKWKAATIILAAVLLAVLTPGTVFVGIYGFRLHFQDERAMRAMQARDEAVRAEQIAREHAEAARIAIEAKKE